MVYSMGNDKPFEMKTPPKMRHKENELSKETRRLISENHISVRLSETGEPIVHVTKKND